MKKILCTSLFFFICFNIFSQEFLSPQNISCNNWLQTLNPGDCVKVGDLDISGNKVTVEALINRTQPYFGGFNYGGDIVSKHTDPNTVNYLLRSNNAEITTTNGYFTTPPICEISLNKTYHVAMVYNGISLKFYRNGFLMSQVPASGQIIQNNFLTTIGDWAAYTSPIGTSFKGFINEVRIWNVEKSQSDLQQYMNSSLPNPTSQAGLKGYYTFNNLLNKAGNSSFDGVLNGSASINTTNPNCNFLADSCGVYDNIINDYTPVVSFDPCLNKISVEDATKFKVGDTVLLIQMKGATINTSNTSNYGNITNLGNCGNYEFNYIKSKSGNVLEFKNLITRSYDIGNGKVQLIRVPYFKTFNITTKLTCLPWNGTIGGVLAFLVKDTLKLNADIDVSGKGFRGGKGVNTFHNSTHCGQLDYYFPSNSILAALKGEGVAETISSMASGRGAQANGGGGGQDHNSGGGGGGNGGMGGYGGYQYQYCDVSGLNRGEGGKPLIYNNASNKIFMGGGGGAGQCNNNGFNSNGGNGGGIVIFKTTTLLTNGFNIISNGIDGLNCINNSINDYCHEGMGGGGAGGTILMDFVNSDILKINLSGGKGANMNNSYNFGKLGPGGGGGGGSLWINSSSIPTTNVNFNGGAAGVNSNLGNDPFGATKGQDGIINYNLLIPFDNIPFKNNIDSLRIDETVSSCKNFNFNAVSFVNFTPVTSWNWDFGDGSSSTSQNTTHTYVNSGNFNVRLIGKDNNGCADTAYKTIRIDIPNVVVDNDTTYCSNTPILRVLHASGGNTYSWSPASSLNNSSSPNPIATVANTTKFYVTVFNIAGCSAKDSITIYVKPQPIVSTIPDISICEGDALQLTTSSTAQNHSWSPATAVSNANSVSPMFTATSNQTLIITGTTTAGCIAKDTVNITVKPKPVIKSIADSTFCGPRSVVLSTTGGNTYSWSPAAGLSNPNIANPTFTGTTPQQYVYYVTGTAANGCSAKDTVKLKLNEQPVVSTISDASICEGDALQLTTSSTAQNHSWSPATAVSNANSASPMFTATSNQTLIITGTTTAGCIAKDTVKITVKPKPVIKTIADSTFCGPRSVVLSTTGGNTYSWSPAAGLSNPNIANPTFTGTTPQQYVYYVTGTAANGCSAKDTVKLKLNEQPVVSTISDASICEGDALQLTTSSTAQNHSWSPATAVSNANSVSPMFTATSNQTLIITGTTTAGCIAKDTVNITVKPKPVIKTIADSTFCGPRSVVLSTTGGNTYSWSPAAGLSNPNIANPTFTGTTPQQYVYYVTGTAANGCSAKDTVKLKLNEQPVVSTISDASICEGDALQLTTSSTAQNHSWSPATAVSNANSVSPMFTATSNQTLIITGTTTAGCIAKDTVNITVKSKPTVKTIPDTTICGTANITLTTTGGNSYSWSPATFLNNPSIANPVFTGNASTLYIVTGTGLNGCSAKDSVQVNVFSKPTFNAPQNKSVCLGNSVQLSGNNGSGFSYSWSPASSLSNTNIEAPFANPATTTNFSVKITDNNCMYDSTFVVVVTVNPRPVIKASKSNDIDCSHPRSNLNASGGTSYVWSPATYLNNSNIGNPVASPTSTIKYVVTGTDINGCSNKDSVTVLLKGLSNFNFVIPNSFTPNNDNLNDCFSLKYWGKMDNFTLRIYNRWGELVFETNDNSVCWDGKYKGKQCEKGNYVYYVRGSSSCGSVNKKGNLLLIR